MNITLISTDTDAWAFGLRSISATLKTAGHRTRLIFLGTSEHLLTQNHLDQLSPLANDSDIIGVSCLAQGSEKAKQVIGYLHQQEKVIVWGGIHAWLNHDECVNWADIVCRGEGEGMMLDLVESISNGGNWKNIENISYQENGELHHNNLRPPIQNLDALPFPDFSFEDEHHLLSKKIVQVFTIPDVKTSGRLLYISSRGCAFHCTYCCNEKLKAQYSKTDRYIRRMSISCLIDHIQNLKKIFPIGKSIYFIDEDFAARPVSELRELADVYPRLIGLPFECLTHPARVSNEKMDLLTEAGLYRINMGIESGSERTKEEIYDRHVSNKSVAQAAKIISRYHQVVPKYFFIIANPFEDSDDLLATVRLITSLPYGSCIQTYNLVFFPGSKLYEMAYASNIINNKHDSGYELNFLGGLRYKKHVWKHKNLYINGLIFLMQGVSTRTFVGSLPRFIIAELVKPKHVEFHTDFPLGIKIAISLQLLFIKIRNLVGRFLRKVTGTPTALIYKFFHSMRTKKSCSSF